MARCVECGFLSGRNVDTRDIEEVEDQFRKTGAPPYTAIGGKEIGYYRQLAMPLCFTRAYALWDEFRALAVGTKDPGPEIILTVINQDRQCSAFTRWQQGFTPKEHRELLDREASVRWQIDREESGRKWQSRQRWLTVIIAGIFTILGSIIGGVIAILSNASGH